MEPLFARQVRKIYWSHIIKLGNTISKQISLLECVEKNKSKQHVRGCERGCATEGRGEERGIKISCNSRCNELERADCRGHTRIVFLLKKYVYVMFATPPLRINVYTSFPRTMSAKWRALSLAERVKKQGISLLPPPKTACSIHPIRGGEGSFGAWRFQLSRGTKTTHGAAGPTWRMYFCATPRRQIPLLRWCTGSFYLGGLIGIHGSSRRYHLSP